MINLCVCVRALECVSFSSLCLLLVCARARECENIPPIPLPRPASSQQLPGAFVYILDLHICPLALDYVRISISRRHDVHVNPGRLRKKRRERNNKKQHGRASVLSYSPRLPIVFLARVSMRIFTPHPPIHCTCGCTRVETS